MTKKSEQPIRSNFDIEIRTRFRVDVDCSMDRPCDEGCHHDMCRCTVIQDAKVTSCQGINTDAVVVKELSKTNRYKQRKLSRIERYCLLRLMVYTGIYNPENYDIAIVGGYYGQEIGGVDFNNRIELQHHIRRMLELKTDIEKIFYVLELEYSYITDDLKTAREADVVTLELTDLVQHDKLIKRREEYVYDLEGEDNKMPQGVVMWSPSGYMYLVDGHHRRDMLLSMGKKKAPYIMIRKLLSF